MPSLTQQLQRINKKIEQDLNEILLTEVSPMIEKELIEEAKTEVYGSYRSENYQRQEGLIDPNNVETRLINTGEIAVKNIYSNESIARYGKTIAELVEYSEGYNWKNVPERPFHQNVRNRLRREKQHVEAMRKGLAQRGFEVR